MVAKNANYLFRVKNNNRATQRKIARQFATKQFFSCDGMGQWSGRTEIRTLRAMAESEHLAKWPGIKMTRNRPNCGNGVDM
jgi:hypothetical protein